ncbi:MAG: sigma-70 family RNA polymerase sigma factor [Holophagales bacterium]|nr:sigma-70 family RNA polymerase sigma factor [Holophagales bacterium]
MPDRSASLPTGCPDAFEFDPESVVIEVRSAAYRAALRAGLSAQDAEDAAQVVVVSLLRMRAPGPKNVMAWTRAVARRVAFRILSSHRLDLLRGEVVHAELSSPFPGISIHSRLDLARALWSLPKKLRRLLILHDAAGETIRDLARRFALTEGSVKVLLCRARSRLRCKLRGYGPGQREATARTRPAPGP